MRKHLWSIVLSQKEIPKIVQEAFPHAQPSRKWTNGTYVVQPVTCDPITDTQLALLKREALPLASDGIHSVSCSSEEVQEHEQPERATEDDSEEYHLYSFTLRGHVAVTEEKGEEIAYGWVKTALEDRLAFDLPENLQHQVKSFAISSVGLTLEDEDDED